MRISRNQMFMEVAHVAAKRSTCARLNVGAVIVYKGRIVSIGWNGAPSGEPHCHERQCPRVPGLCVTVHAEANAIEFARRQRVPLNECTLYVTHSPCPGCCEAIHQAGLKAVMFGTSYRDTTALTSLIETGIQVFQVLPCGYVIDLERDELLNEG